MAQEATISVDPQAHAAIIIFKKEGDSVRTEPATKNRRCLMDFNQTGEVLSVEVLDINEGVELEGLPEDIRSVVEEKLREEGIEIVS